MPKPEKRGENASARAEAGFTRFGLLKALVVIGLLAAAGVLAYGEVVERVHEADCRSNQKQIEEAAVRWTMEHHSRKLTDVDDITILDEYFLGGEVPVCPDGDAPYTIEDGVVACPNGHQHY